MCHDIAFVYLPKLIVAGRFKVLEKFLQIQYVCHRYRRTAIKEIIDHKKLWGSDKSLSYCGRRLALI